jgi:hypothetical protein
MKPEMARLTLARKIAAITLIVWKKSVLRRPISETTNSLSVSGKNPFHPWESILAVVSRVLATLGFEGESQPIS